MSYYNTRVLLAFKSFMLLGIDDNDPRKSSIPNGYILAPSCGSATNLIGAN